MSADGFELELKSSIKGADLDDYLARGWFRMGMFIFTTRMLPVRGEDYPVYWLRYVVDKFPRRKSFDRLWKLNDRFTTTIRPLTITPELEALHGLYYDSILFSTAGTLREILESDEGNIFDTQVIEVREDGKLIAAGIFDRGEQAISGIKCIYDPAYKKFSPGKFLILLKHRFCMEQGLRWYYPGYFSPTYPKFNYKLFIGKEAIEVYSSAKQAWVPYAIFEQEMQIPAIPCKS